MNKTFFTVLTILFASQHAFADITFVAKQEIIIKPNTSETIISDAGCFLNHKNIKTEGYISKDSTFKEMGLERNAEKPLIMEALNILESIGGKLDYSNSSRTLNFKIIQSEIQNLGGSIDAEKLLNNSKNFDKLARALLMQVGQKTQPGKIKCYSDLKNEIKIAGGELTATPEDLINHYMIESFVIRSNKTDQLYKVECVLDGHVGLDMIQYGKYFKLTEDEGPGAGEL